MVSIVNKIILENNLKTKNFIIFEFYFTNIVLDETGLCPSCVIDEIEPLLEKLVQVN